MSRLFSASLEVSSLMPFQFQFPVKHTQKNRQEQEVDPIKQSDLNNRYYSIGLSKRGTQVLYAFFWKKCIKIEFLETLAFMAETTQNCTVLTCNPIYNSHLSHLYKTKLC